MAPKKEYLRRYIDLPSLIYLLGEQSLTFLDPVNWDDKNDKHFMQLYKGHKNLKTLLAICFTEKEETYHQWKSFGHGTSGVCIKFDKTTVIEALRQGGQGIRMGAMSYVSMRTLDASSHDDSELPFLKRLPYKAEGEFRAIYEDSAKQLQSLDVKIPISCIERITVSPWMPRNVYLIVKKTIKQLTATTQTEVHQSQIIKSTAWENFGQKIVDQSKTTSKTIKPAKKR